MRAAFIGSFAAGMSWAAVASLLQLEALNSPEALRVTTFGVVVGFVSGGLALAARPRARRWWARVLVGLSSFVITAGLGGAVGGAAMVDNPAVVALLWPTDAEEKPVADTASGKRQPKQARPTKGPELELDRQTRRVVARLEQPYRAAVPTGATRLLFGIGVERNQPPAGEVVVRTVGTPPTVVWRGTVDRTELARWQEVAVDVPDATEIEFSVTSSNERSGVVVSEPTFVRPRTGHTPRNLILISIDTLRADMLGCYGFTEFPTSPRLDALAARGVLFENAFAPTPWTTPSHLALLTGVQPDALGLTRLKQSARLARERVTIAEVFRDAGYLTVAFTGSATMGANHGFSDGFYFQQESYARKPKWPRDLDTNTYHATQWLHAHREEPLFLFFHTFEVHDPYAHHRFLHEKVTGKDSFRVSYVSGIGYTDTMLGHFLDELDEMGLLEDSIVAVTSDHGEGFGAWPRNYHGKTLYDEVLRVPLILAGAGLPKGRRVEAQVPTLDLFATLADLYGLTLPEDVDSRSLRPLWEGTSNAPRPVHLCCVSPHRRKKGANLEPQLMGIRLDGWKYVISEDGDEQLYDLAWDPDEQNNLATTFGGVTKKMRALVMETTNRNLTRAGMGKGSKSRRIDPEYEKKLRALGYMH